MRKLHFYKALADHPASNLRQGKPESLTLIFAKPLKLNHVRQQRREMGSESLTRLVFTREGGQLEEVLYETLPGGTYDHLLAQMLYRKASLFVVSHVKPQPQTKESKKCQEKRKPGQKRPAQRKPVPKQKQARKRLAGQARKSKRRMKIT